ncbi:hypothetical protein KP509_29G081200 [Ceratopteris richardii]|uniref:Pentatricopeptide repeat-containing protein n=1 Tax=Ceratopteris richardii TaxID=49495 RepID=A0A8T2R9H7_CERRI|nr:hypothetical protein KP509_29G081200 [Ceratopteris richardii]KAH7292688.1 hypothetical protein KP509_29G081200 [Ceratopteris richardii]KAH7292689.1 hypothetical protein KP509_29G081200 [Ceratopteris richardii]KAH7292690.1 hypothetical protein KP509_29G081200 [Ceratopteris richardii]KAH7292691.1 hypothetical protein KP509_29G081200 [Ceratopteris richardii]
MTCIKLKELSHGNRLHADLVKAGMLGNKSDRVNALIDIYNECGALSKTASLLLELPVQTLSVWNKLIGAYVQHGQGERALDCYKCMQTEGVAPNEVTFSCVLKACGNIGALYMGCQVHDEIVKRSLLQHNVVIGNALVDMYAKCGALNKALDVLEGLPIRNVISWTSLISGYAKNGLGKEALACYQRMKSEGVAPNVVTFTCMLKACGSIRALNEGVSLHDEIVVKGLLDKDVMLGNAVVDMYAKCGALAKAHEVFEGIHNCNVVTWNTLIAGYVQEGQVKEALSCFEQMQSEGFVPNAVTLTSILKACGNAKATEVGEKIHEKIDKEGLLGKNVILGTALMDMYIKCGALMKAQEVHEKFTSRDVVSWTTLIEGFSQHSQVEEALNCIKQMQREGITPNTITFSCILRACGSIGDLEIGKQIHDEIINQGLGISDMLGTALVDMYARCGALPKAHQVLEELPTRTVACWTALIDGYAQEGQGEEALRCFEKMQHEGFPPDALTFVCALKACSSIGVVDKGKEIHDQVSRQGLLHENIILGTALVDMYAKCGALEKACTLLEELPASDAVPWNTLIAGYAQQGQSEQVLECFKKMESKGISPDAFTMFCILNACNHSGLVDEAQIYFANFSSKHGTKLDLEHYTCMIDLYGRAGHLEKAVTIFQKMPHSTSNVALHALLGACCKWRDVKMGRWAFEQAVQIDKSDATPYIYMANIYAHLGMHEYADAIGVMREEFGGS